MKIGKCEFSEILLDKEFDYKKLYNDSRGSVHKEVYKTLLSGCLEKGIIKVSKYEFGEITNDQFYEMIDEKGKNLYRLKERLKNYHQESDYRLVSLLYLLKIGFQDYQIVDDMIDVESEIIKNYPNILIGKKFDKGNAIARIYLKDSGDVILTQNDQIENLINCIEKVENGLWVVGDERLKGKRKFVAYKVEKTIQFNSLKNKAERFHLDKIFNSEQKS